MTDTREALTVVICSDFGNITGGQAKVAIESAIGLKKQGHRVIFFAATGPAGRLEARHVAVREATAVRVVPNRASTMAENPPRSAPVTRPRLSPKS